MFYSQTVFTAAFVLCTSLAAAAQSNLPIIDIRKSCEVRAKASADILVHKTTISAFESCMSSEKKALDALVAAWKDMPSSYKARCIAPNAYSPSYVEWISCLEMHIDVKRLHKD